MADSTSPGRDVYLVDGTRTPFLKARGRPGPFSASDLALQAGRPLLARMPFEPDALDEVILGCCMPREDEANIARVVSLRLGCGDKVPAYSVHRNCGSGLQALDEAVYHIRTGRSDLVLAGGTESMSHAPLVFNDQMVNWLADWNMARSFSERLKVAARFRPGFVAPIVGLLKGLSDPIVGLSMGQTAEILAHRFGISREQMDEFAVRSHHRLAEAAESGWLDEIEPLYDSRGKVYQHDDGVRPDSSVDKLAKLKPAFDRKFGKVTAGNSAQITDGASLLMVASEEAVRRHDLPVMARLVDVRWAGLDPAQMGLGPVHASTALLQANKMKRQDVDYWEINEAFATQVLACLAAWEDKDYCKNELGLSKPFGRIADDRLNVDGGGVSIGHPVGTSGARIVLHLIHVLQRKKARRGVATMCIGGGQGGAALIELADGVGAGRKTPSTKSANESEDSGTEQEEA